MSTPTQQGPPFAWLAFLVIVLLGLLIVPWLFKLLGVYFDWVIRF